MKNVNHEFLISLAETLHAQTIVGSDRRLRITPPKGWAEAKVGDEYKAMLVSGDLFAKVFTPTAKPFAEQLYKTTVELGKLPLDTPVLPPVGFENGVIFFHTGTFHFKWILDSILPKVQANEVRRVILANGLEPLSAFDYIEVFTLNGKDHMVDVVDDSPVLIEEFLAGDRNRISALDTPLQKS